AARRLGEMVRVPGRIPGAAQHRSGMQYVFLYIIWDSIDRNGNGHSIFFMHQLVVTSPRRRVARREMRRAAPRPAPAPAPFLRDVTMATTRWSSLSGPP